MTDDPTLLRRFAAQRCQTSFAELVQRHLGLVYHSALRVTDGDTALAEDAAQATFLLAAEKAATLCEHPELVGWLYTTACHKARELRRSEERRHRREQTATTMNELHGDPTNDEAWNRVRPVIDDALLELPPEDRTAVVLRFFEGRAFAEIGTSLRVGENAARMRVERALDRLQGSLAKRGLTSTAAALALVLAVPAALAAPVGLAGRITGAALAGAAMAGAGGTAVSLLQFMTSSKILAVMSGIAAAAALGTAVYFRSELQSARAETLSLHDRQHGLEEKARDLESRLAAAQTRVVQLEDATKRGAADAAARSPVAGSPSAAAGPLTEASVDARLKRAHGLARAGQSAEALQEYLLCLDAGMLRFPRFFGVRRSFLLSYIASLGKTFPPALEALCERRDAAERRVVSDSNDGGAVGLWSLEPRARRDRPVPRGIRFDPCRRRPAGGPRVRCSGSARRSEALWRARASATLRDDDPAL